MGNIFLKIRRIIAKLLIFFKTPRLSFLLFQIRYIERFTGIDTFFLSPRRIIIYLIESFYLRNQDSVNLHDYGNYKLVKEKISRKPIVYSGGVGTNISFDLEINKKNNAKVRLFDPTQNSIQFMKKYRNKKNFFFYPIALFHKNKRVKIYFDPTNRVKSNSINNFLEFNKKNFYYCRAKNLSKLVKEFGDKKIDILKLDIEGVAENLLLQMFKKRIHPTQIIFALEVPFNYIKYYKFLKNFFYLSKIMKSKYKLYNLRTRSRGVEMEILAVKK
jgi:FkbM family methyltransferase